MSDFMSNSMSDSSDISMSQKWALVVSRWQRRSGQHSLFADTDVPSVQTIARDITQDIDCSLNPLKRPLDDSVVAEDVVTKPDDPLVSEVIAQLVRQLVDSVVDASDKTSIGRQQQQEEETRREDNTDDGGGDCGLVSGDQLVPNMDDNYLSLVVSEDFQVFAEDVARLAVKSVGDKRVDKWDDGLGATDAVVAITTTSAVPVVTESAVAAIDDVSDDSVVPQLSDKSLKAIAASEDSSPPSSQSSSQTSSESSTEESVVVEEVPQPVVSYPMALEPIKVQKFRKLPLRVGLNRLKKRFPFNN